MFGLPLSFAFPWLLVALVSLPIIWWLLRLTPPRPRDEPFPPTRILARLVRRDETPAKSPWWLTLLRLTMAALVIAAMAGPVWKPVEPVATGDGVVALVMDDGWASGPGWEDRRRTALRLVDEAEAAGLAMVLITTAGGDAQNTAPASPRAVRERLTGMENRPIRPDHAIAAELLRRVDGEATIGSVFWLSDGIGRTGTPDLAAALNGFDADVTLYLADGNRLAAINHATNDPDAMIGEIARVQTDKPATFVITGIDEQGRPVARQTISMVAREKSADFRFDEPVEVRNDITRIVVDAADNAGAVRLLDDNARRRLVGLISGEKHDNSQPLLSPLYYISRALQPFADIRRADDANVAAAVPELLALGVSALVLADIGTVAEEAEGLLAEWVSAGGMLVRFAGPRLAAAPDNDLLPVRIRLGDRAIGGALSWDQPRPVAPFETTSPFYGLEPPQEVTVSRQVLALQEAGLAERTWATLDDGTPLVTAAKRGAGWIVLFHVSSDATWSNLPISGTFVEMLRRVVSQSQLRSGASAADGPQSLPPLRLLDGRGRLGPPGIDAKPLVLASEAVRASADNPPGYYGTEDGLVALNLFDGDAELDPLQPDVLGGEVRLASYLVDEPVALQPWLLFAAASLLVLDCLAVLWMAGLVRQPLRRARSAATGIAAAMLVSLLAADPAGAQEDDIDFSAALQTRLAYVVTGVREVDEVSEAGLRGLTRFLINRTALEPGEPIGVDVAVDELAFFALLYWPIHPAADMPDAATMARVDAFMKQGGSILFDTRDQVSGALGGTSVSPESLALQQLLSGLDIPPLEPVPPDHVLTKAFYLLDSFPGRYSGGDLWVEQLALDADAGERPARAGDGVSSILITSNDLAGAWAVDEQLRPLFPTVPPDALQREFAFRAGVNLMMYAMTGNYKADQVHVPALLERLGQ